MIEKLTCWPASLRVLPAAGAAAEPGVPLASAGLLALARALLRTASISASAADSVGCAAAGVALLSAFGGAVFDFPARFQQT